MFHSIKTRKMAAIDPLQQVFANANYIHNALVAAGIPEPAASYATYQVYHETGAFKNAGWKQYRNASGIMFAGQRGATKGPNGYAVFNTYNDWLNAFRHELTKGAAPAQAQSLEQFNTRLVANGYYTANPSDYLSGMKRARLVLKIIPSTDRAGFDPATGTRQAAQDMDIPGTTNYSLQPGKFPWIPVGIGVGILILVKNLFN